jgi:hypothetical protein
MRIECAGADLMELRLLSFTSRCNAAVVRAESLTHARPLAVTDGLGRASHFDEGFAIDPELAAQIPPSLIGRQLSGDDAADLLTTLMIGLRQVRWPRRTPSQARV